MVGIAKMRHKLKLLNLLTSTLNYFATEPKFGGDHRHQWIDRDEKLHCLHLKSNGRETPDEDRIRAFFRRKRGNTQECENASQFWGKRNGNPISIFFNRMVGKLQMKRGLRHSLGGNEGNTQECENPYPTWILFFVLH